jgi:hypothetical protein
MRQMIIWIDRSVRAHLERCCLRAALVPVDPPAPSPHGAVAARLHLAVDTMVSPRLERVAVRWEGVPPGVDSELVLLEDGGRILARGVADRANAEIAFAIEERIVADKEVVPFRGAAATRCGLFVSGMPDGGGLLTALPTVKTYLIACSGGASAGASLALVAMQARNSVTGSRISVEWIARSPWR